MYFSSLTHHLNFVSLYFHQNVRCTFCTLVFNLKFLLSTDFSQGQIWCMLWCMPWGPTWLYGNLSFADTETIQRSRPAQRAAFTCSWRDGLTAWRELSQRRRPQLPKSKSSTEDQSRSLQQGWVTPAGEVQVALCTVQPRASSAPLLKIMQMSWVRIPDSLL